jgi:5-methylcytosine-specific restriction endonuclease McrA
MVAIKKESQSLSNKYCSKKCAKKANRGAGNHLNARGRHATRQTGATYEPIDPKKVFERDGWVCHICGKKMRRSLIGGHKLGPTVDHLVPLARGGDHTYANVAAAHMICNATKRSFGGGEQLALVG